MKTFNYTLLLLMLLLTMSCTTENEFSVLEKEIEEPTIHGTLITIDAIKGILGQELEKNGENAKVIFKETDNYIEGYVISSDKAGNFFKELILQDKPTKPTAGIRLLLDENPLFTFYEFGRKVYVKLDGLSLGIENGVPTLGISEGNTIGAIPSFGKDDIILRSIEIATIAPLKITLEEFTDQLLLLFIKVENLQFMRNQVLDNNIFTYAAESNDKFDGERILESCVSRRTTVLSTSTFSDFKGLKLPSQQGSFEGILTKNYLGNRYNLVLNSPADLTFDNETRCDPIVLKCPEPSIVTRIIFEEDFTDAKTKDLETEGWINVNKTGGKLTYKTGDFAENRYLQITGYRSKESLYEVWLVTPNIDLSMSANEILSFDLQAGYDNGNIIEVFITDNFTDDITTTTWHKLDITIPRAPLNAFGSIVPIGPIGISCLGENIRIGFRYIGGDPRATTRYHIDNIKILGE